MPSSEPAEAGPERPVRGNPFVAVLLAWLLPGAGHLYLGRWRRGAAFFALVLSAVGVGLILEGKIWQLVSGQFLSYLGTLACVGLGSPYFALRFGLGYEGRIDAQGFEYGGAFILTAGLMNLLLILDAWDLARGVKE